MTGTGFIDAGVMWSDPDSRTVEGLTTAATAWVTAALGIACGRVSSQVAAVSVAPPLFLLVVVARHEALTGKERNRNVEPGKQRNRESEKEVDMGICEQCGNDYDKAFAITMNGKTHLFDSFECAIAALAPRCPQCGVRVVGHGVEHDNTVYCCAHCATREGAHGIVDRN